jgi:uncharacterized membrane protein
VRQFKPLEIVMKAKLTSYAVATVVGGLALAAVSPRAAQAGPVAQPSGSEKCYGIAKAGKNDCAAGVHSCAGQGTQDRDKDSFVYLPAGACSKISGGSTSPAK